MRTLILFITYKVTPKKGNFLQTMYSGLMVTGGNSLLMGFTERLNHDLAHKCPPVGILRYIYLFLCIAFVFAMYQVCYLQTIKLRVYAAPTPMERRFGAWIGGSILASLVSSGVQCIL